VDILKSIMDGLGISGLFTSDSDDESFNVRVCHKTTKKRIIHMSQEASCSRWVGVVNNSAMAGELGLVWVARFWFCVVGGFCCFMCFRTDGTFCFRRRSGGKFWKGSRVCHTRQINKVQPLCATVG
jgi:hypothetical protein